jgi:ribosomal protein S27E
MNNSNSDPAKTPPPAGAVSTPEVQGRSAYERRSVQCPVCGAIREVYAAAHEMGRCPNCGTHTPDSF